MRRFLSVLVLVAVVLVGALSRDLLGGWLAPTPTPAPTAMTLAVPTATALATATPGRTPPPEPTRPAISPPATAAAVLPTATPARPQPAPPTAAPAKPQPAAPTTAPAASNPTPSTPVSRQEAEGLVRAYFAAFEAKDYDRLRSLTTGSARQTTDALVQQLQAEEQNRNVSAQVRITRQDTIDVIEGPAQTRVETDYAAEIYAGFGILQVKVGSLGGQAGFIIQRENGAARISEITGGFG